MSASFYKNVVVLGTGGTIAGLISDPSRELAYVAAQVGVSVIAAQSSLEDILRPLNWGLLTEQLAQIDSKDMDRSIWHALCSRCLDHLNDPKVTAIVITHGTDTLSETAYFLSRLFGQADKPVVITGAMRAHNDPSPDGPQNLKDAVDFAVRLDQAGFGGVWVVFDDLVHDPMRVKKVSAQSLNAFHSFESDGLRDSIASNRRVSHRSTPMYFEPMADPMVWASWRFDPAVDPQTWPRVELLTCHADMGSHLFLDHLIDLKVKQNHIDKSDSLSGLVVSGLGGGTWPKVLEDQLKRLLDLGVWVVLSSQVPWGQGQAPKGSCLSHAHFSFTTLDPSKARIALMLHLIKASSTWL